MSSLLQSPSAEEGNRDEFGELIQTPPTTSAKQEILEKMVEGLDQYMIDENFNNNSEDEEDEEDFKYRDNAKDFTTPSYIVEDNLDFKNYSHIKKPDGTTFSSTEEILNFLINEKKVFEKQLSTTSISNTDEQDTTTTDTAKEYHKQRINQSEFGEQLENELKSLPSAVVNTYFEQSSELVELHKYIKESRNTLTSFGESFDEIIFELSDLIKDMPDNHVASLQISKSLENRIVTREEICKLVEKVTIPPSLIKNITSDELNEDYVKYIMELQDRIGNLDSLMGTKAKFIQDISLEIDLLKKKASRSVRDFLLKLIIGLRKPRTNIQILQQSKLFKYSPLNEFLYNNSPSAAIDVKNCYIETVSKIFGMYFKNYLSSLTKVFYQVALKSDVIGYIEQPKGYFGNTGKGFELNKASAFNLYISGLPIDIWTSIRSEVIEQVPERFSRADILTRCLDAPLIIPHVAIKNNKKYPFEQIFRSMNILLLDTICSEYLFNRQWFAKPLLVNSPDALIPSIFDKIFQMYYDNLYSFVGGTYDCLSLLLCLQINRILIQLLVDRKLWDRISCVKNYFQKVDIIIWDRFSEAFKRNIDSLKAAMTQKESTPLDNRPHIYTRRFSEFYSSIAEILSHSEDPRVLAWVAVLRSSMERLLIHFSNSFPDPKSKSIFLINNYDVVITVFTENNINQNEEGYILFLNLLQEQINVFVELLLFSYYKTLISFIKDTEFSVSNIQNYQIDKNQLSLLVNEFSQKWRDILSKIQNDIMTNFSNFNLGSNITKKIISQYLLYYKRFEEIYKKFIKQQQSINDGNNSNQQQLRLAFIPVSTITYEISKSYSSFSP